jgi:hypothetical protein
MFAPPITAAPSNPPDPPQDRAAGGIAKPSRSGRLLNLVRKLIDYGKELVSTLQNRASTAQVHDIASRFGTRDIGLIVARITRGLCLAGALEQRVIQCAARLDASPPARTASHQPAPRKVRPAGSSARPAARDAGSADAASVLAHMPTPEEIAAQVRRRPIGAVLADICNDLGIVASHPLWRELHDAVDRHGGNFIRVMRDMLRRATALVMFRPPDESPTAPAPADQPAFALLHAGGTSTGPP